MKVLELFHLENKMALIAGGSRGPSLNIAMGRIGQTGELAGAALYLCSPQVPAIDGSMTA